MKRYNQFFIISHSVIAGYMPTIMSIKVIRLLQQETKDYTVVPEFPLTRVHKRSPTMRFGSCALYFIRKNAAGKHDSSRRVAAT